MSEIISSTVFIVINFDEFERSLIINKDFKRN